MRLARQSFYFGRPVRGVLGDFSVLIAISVAAGVKFLFFPDVFVRLTVGAAVDVRCACSITGTRPVVDNLRPTCARRTAANSDGSRTKSDDYDCVGVDWSD
ncbi:unnamed protein product [Sphagnum balticum]